MSDRGVYTGRRRISRLGWSGREWARRDLGINAAGQTLGEALLRSIAKRGHTNHQAAALMATARANVDQWTNDLIDPWPENYEALTEYLGVEMDTLGVLIIHSQMRRAELRNQRLNTKRGPTTGR